MVKYCLNILLGLFFVLLPTTAEAVVFVPYNITGDVVWNKASGPYIINGSIVNSGSSLTIEPGTVVKFKPNAFLWVYGDLDVNGSNVEKVYFTSIKDDEVGGDTNSDENATLPGPANWNQISVRSGGIGNIDNAVIRYGGNTSCGYHTYCKGGVYNAHGNLNLTNSQVSNNGQFGIYHAYGTTIIENSEIFYNERGVHINSGALSINYSSIHDNVVGVLNNYNNGVIDATNNWWGDSSGPTTVLNPGGIGDSVYNGVIFTPWLGSEPRKEINPVIIIPGIMGSWEKNGEWVIDPVLHTYDDLINTLVLNGYEKGVDLFTLPYDWRNSNVDTALILDQKIDDVKAVCLCEKVDIVAHSMGGLISRQYIQSDDYNNDVDQLIFLGTPHLGSPKAYLMWEGGEVGVGRIDTLIKFVYTKEAQKNGYDGLFDYVINKPIISIQQLLPTFDYLMEYESSAVRLYPNRYPQNEFLEDLNRNINTLFDSGVTVTNIIGNEQETIGKIKVIDSPYLQKWEHGYPIGYYEKNGDRGLVSEDGDDTVTLSSSGFVDNGLNILDSNHISLPKNGQSLIFEKLTGAETDILSNKFILPGVKLLLIKILSPVDVQVIAPDGQRIGKDFETGGEFNEIDGAFYSGFETDNEYITIFNPLDGEYSVIAQGTGGGGEYTVAVGMITNEGLVENNFVSHILPDNFEEISIAISSNLGEIEEETNISLTDLILHVEQVYLLGWISGEKLKSKLLKIVDKAIKEEKKVHKNRGTSKIQRILEKEFVKTLNSGLKTRKISEEGYNLLKEDISLIINIYE